MNKNTILMMIKKIKLIYVCVCGALCYAYRPGQMFYYI